MRFAIFLLLVFSIIIFMDNYQDNIENEGLIYLNKSIEVSINSCYGTEGKYPSNLEYLIDNYGLVINENKYIVYYETFGSNIRPNIKVIKRD